VPALTGFSADWLALREPADHAARSAPLTRALLDALPHDAPWRVLDLAAGTGSNLRYVTDAAFRRPRPAADAARPAHAWLLVDHDPALLARVPVSADVETRCMDLASLDDRRIFDGRTLVTASALLDLVSERWLRALAPRCADAGAAALFALNYDGRIACAPEDFDDAAIVALVNAHQRTDKGFGPALGPEATDCCVRGFTALGYRTRRERSDWLLTPASAELQRQLIAGWADAAAEAAPDRAALVGGWRRRRLAHVDAGRLTLVVGHEDFAAWPL
jgi:hypothetical protein